MERKQTLSQLLAGAALMASTASLGQVALLQVIHNCADLAAASVDVYVNDVILLNDFAFRTATPYLEVPSGVDLVVAIAPSSSTSSAEAIYTETFNLSGEFGNVIVANGTISPSGYAPATPFSLELITDVVQNFGDASTALYVVHGSTDAPTVDITAEAAPYPLTTIVDDISYSETNSAFVYTRDYVMQVQSADGNNLVAAYEAPLGTLGLAYTSIVVLASGFLDPTVNSNGPAFGLWAALPAGGDLYELPVITNVGMGDVADATNFSAWPNPANDVLNLSIDAAEAYRANLTLTDMTGRIVLQMPSAMVNVGENRMAISLGALAEGLYTVSVSSDNGIRTTPIQVVR